MHSCFTGLTWAPRKLPPLKLATVTAILLTTLQAQNVSYRVVPATSPYNPPGYVVGHKINKLGWIPLTDSSSGRPDQPPHCPGR
jgi:hypothetical protein